MLRLAFILSAAVFGFSAYAQNLEKLNTRVYNWNDLKVTKTESGARRQIFEGFTGAFTYFEVHVTTLNPGNAPHSSHVHTTLEEMIIVKEGRIEQDINGIKKVLGPGSVVLVSPGDDHGIRNAGESQATYYIICWKVDEPIDQERSGRAVGSQFYDWDDMEFKTTAKGGRRQIMQRPTATLEELEMHVTTLNEGVISHDEHIHESEEIILVIKGEVEESFNGIHHKVGPGSLILLVDNVSHGIRNAGKVQCEYFAFKWKTI
ncbi:MAG: cupin domain-containing protein [Bacteroidales bacterium]|nr:cupin domain-containing protein [Bacteroidales bacterium]